MMLSLCAPQAKPIECARRRRKKCHCVCVCARTEQLPRQKRQVRSARAQAGKSSSQYNDARSAARPREREAHACMHPTVQRHRDSQTDMRLCTYYIVETKSFSLAVCPYIYIYIYIYIYALSLYTRTWTS
jgi:hypothetical protein